jgi:hypothetical protein
MTKGIRAIAVTCVALGILTFAWIVCDLIFLANDLEGVLFGSWGIFVGIGYLVMLLLHGIAFVLVLTVIARLKGYAALKAVTVAALVASLFMIAVQKVMYDEVGREIRAGMDAGEISFVNLGLVVNAACCLLVIGVAVLALRKGLGGPALDKGASVFTLAQYMGIVSGLLGLLLTFGLIGRQVPIGRLWIYAPFYLLFLVPYAATVLFWLALKRREAVSDWYDEKQWKDVSLAALTTLALSLPALTLFLLVRDAVGVYWYPYYLFVVLTLFSGSTLFFYRRA